MPFFLRECSTASTIERTACDGLGVVTRCHLDECGEGCSCTLYARLRTAAAELGLWTKLARGLYLSICVPVCVPEILECLQTHRAYKSSTVHISCLHLFVCSPCHKACLAQWRAPTARPNRPVYGVVEGIRRSAVLRGSVVGASGGGVTLSCARLCFVVGAIHTLKLVPSLCGVALCKLSAQIFQSIADALTQIFVSFNK